MISSTELRRVRFFIWIVVGIAALAPVPFVRLDPGLEFAAEQRLVARQQTIDLVILDQLFDDEEPVLVELLDLLPGKLDHRARPSFRAGSRDSVRRPSC